MVKVLGVIDAFERSEFVDASAGAADAGKPAVLGADGKWDSSMLPASGGDIGSSLYDYKHAGQWYMQPRPLGPVQSVAMPGAGTLAIANPFVADRFGGTLNGLAIRVTVNASAGATGKLGLYSNVGNRNLYPDAKLLETAAFAIDSVGEKIEAVSYALTAGALYWLVFVWSVAPSVTGLSPSGGVESLLGATTGNLNFNPWYNYKTTNAAFAGVTLPATFPAGAAMSNEVGGIFTRVAA
jgi:hypothetical protein